MWNTVGRGGRPMGRMTVVVSFAILASTPLGLMGPAAAAASDESVTQVSTVDVSGLHFLSEVCGTPIVQDGVLYVSSIELSDGRILQPVRVDVQLTSNGKVAYERPAFTVMIDPQTGTVTLEGTLVNISAAGEGILLQDVGRLVRDLGTSDILSLVGRWMIVNGEFEEVCSFFAS
jgi:hypothetical protein